MNLAFFIFALLPVIAVLITLEWTNILPVICGIGAAVASLIIETNLAALLGQAEIALTPAISAFVIVATVEEITKYSTLNITSSLRGRKTRVVLNATLCGAGFASTENLLYTLGFWNIFGDTPTFSALSLVRFFMPFMMHLVNAPILVSGHVIKGFRPIGGIVLAGLSHGSYDAILSSASTRALRVAYLIIISEFIVSALIFRESRRQRGRVS